MGRIIQLPQEVIKKIAAGEVIEHPVNVVKELVENSIDANANEIKILLEDSGLKEIIVEDNGVGMDYSDLVKCTDKHTTSKIKKIEDLFSIHTLGFRGEALSSIKTVSYLEIFSKSNDDVGYKLFFRDGKKFIEKYPFHRGTKVVVKELFYNLPARRKFLNSPRAELLKIINLMYHYVIGFPELRFIVKNNSKELMNFFPVKDHKTRLIQFFGNSIEQYLYEFRYDEDTFSIGGTLTLPTFSKPTKSKLTVLVNNRPVFVDALYEAITKAYGRLLDKRYPVGIVKINISPEFVDVNVHPKKYEVKFASNKILDFVTNSIRSSLEKKPYFSRISGSILLRSRVKERSTLSEANQVIKVKEKSQTNEGNDYMANSIKFDMVGVKSKRESGADKQSNTDLSQAVSIESFREKNDRQTMISNYISRNDAHGKYTVSQKYLEMFGERKIIGQENFLNVSSKDEKINELANITEIKAECNKTIETLKNGQSKEIYRGVGNYNINEFVYLGQFHKSYLLFEYHDLLIIIDQHAAEERVNYELLKRNIQLNIKEKQYLLEPLTVFLDNEEFLLFNQCKQILESIGFEFEDFGKNFVKLKSIPVAFNINIDEKEFKELLYSFDPKKRIDEQIDDMIKTLACKRSIKAGQELTEAYARNLIIKLFSCEYPYTCPHGRPIILILSLNDLEKLFFRKEKA